VRIRRGVNHAREGWNEAVISAKPAATVNRAQKGDGKGTSGITDEGRRERAAGLLTEFRKD